MQTKFDSCIVVSYGSGIVTEIDTTLQVTLFLRPNLQKLKTYKNGKLSILCSDGHVSWSKTGDKQVVTSVGESMYIQSTIMMSLNDVLLEDEFTTYRGREVVEGRSFEVLQVKRREWLRSYLYYFDVESGLLSYTVAHEAKNKMRTSFLDYREISGMLWPFVEESFVEGKLVLKSLRVVLKIDQAMNSEEFRP